MGRTTKGRWRSAFGVACLVLSACGGKSTSDQGDGGDPCASGESTCRDPVVGPGNCQDSHAECLEFSRLYCEWIHGCFAGVRGLPFDEGQLATCMQEQIRLCELSVGDEAFGHFPSCIEHLRDGDCHSVVGRAQMVSELRTGESPCLLYGTEGPGREGLPIPEVLGELARGADGCVNPGLRLSGDRCVALAGEGADCGDGGCVLFEPLRCEAGTCVRKGLEGEPCTVSIDEACDDYLGLRCIEGVCQKPARAGADETCGLVRDYGQEAWTQTIVECQPDFVCGNYSDLGFGRCLVPAAIGEECSYEQPCVSDGRCGAQGRCEFYPPYCVD